MLNNITRLIVLVSSLSFTSYATADSNSDAQLFNTTCARCHTSAANIKTDIAHVPAILRSGSVRQHRFTLSDSEIDIIIQYLSALKK